MSADTPPPARTSGDDPLEKAERLSAELCTVLKLLPPAEQLLVLRSLSDKIDSTVPLTRHEQRRNRLALVFAVFLTVAGAALYGVERMKGTNGMTGGTVMLLGLILLAGALSPYLVRLLRKP
ncbi:MAG: hypothetical protein KIT79_09930 [Deltaproteobacteria bacterium]|nr:hypothetical protein [Deltaproteobacteria bacterium]